jgi:hypothetical protein
MSGFQKTIAWVASAALFNAGAIVARQNRLPGVAANNVISEILRNAGFASDSQP